MDKLNSLTTLSPPTMVITNQSKFMGCYNCLAELIAFSLRWHSDDNGRNKSTANEERLPVPSTAFTFHGEK